MPTPSPPQPFKPRQISSRVPDGVLNVPTIQRVLNQLRIRALIGKPTRLQHQKPNGDAV